MHHIAKTNMHLFSAQVEKNQFRVMHLPSAKIEKWGHLFGMRLPSARLTASIYL